MTPIDGSLPRQPGGLDVVGLQPPVAPAADWSRKFRDELAVDVAFEAGLLVKEAWIIAIIVVLLLLREVML
jgi:hypothetical protein